MSTEPLLSILDGSGDEIPQTAAACGFTYDYETKV